MIEWRKVAGQMRADLDRAALNENPRLVLAVLIKATLMKGRTVVILPEWESLCALLGIYPQHVKGIRQQIEDAGIARFRPVAEGWECVVQPDASQWACDFVCQRDQVNQWVAWLERVPGQAQGSLLPAEPNLRQAMADVGAEAVSNKKCYSPPGGNRQQATKFVTPQPPERAAGTPLSLQGSKPLQAFSIERSKAGQRPGALEARLMDRCRELFGEKIMAVYGANWRLRARADAGKLQRVLDDTAAAMREGRVKTIPAAYANDAWGRFQ